MFESVNESAAYRSSYGNNVQINGNKKIIIFIKSLAENSIQRNIDLYTALVNIKNLLAEKYGENWLYKSQEAVEFIVETAYCDDERKRLPLIDKLLTQYYNDMSKGKLW